MSSSAMHYLMGIALPSKCQGQGNFTLPQSGEGELFSAVGQRRSHKPSAGILSTTGEYARLGALARCIRNHRTGIHGNRQTIHHSAL